MKSSRFLLLSVVTILAGTVALAQEKPAASTRPVPVATAKALPRIGEAVEIKVSEVKLNQHVRLMLGSGLTFNGVVTELNRDYVTLNMSFEKSGFLGSITFARLMLKKVFLLPPITEAKVRFELTRRTEQRNKARRTHHSWLTSRRQKAQLERAGEVTKTLLAGAEKTQKEIQAQKELLEEFPEKEGWSLEKLVQIHQRRQMLGQQPTAREQRFMKVFPDWLKAKSVAQVMKARQAAERRELLVKFPPAKGWGAKKLAEIQAKQASGAALTTEETEFKEKYADWETALKESMPTPAPAPAAPAAP